MARALRIECPGGRCHFTARGNERRDIFRDDRDRVVEEIQRELSNVEV